MSVLGAGAIVIAHSIKKKGKVDPKIANEIKDNLQDVVNSKNIQKTTEQVSDVTAKVVEKAKDVVADTTAQVSDASSKTAEKTKDIVTEVTDKIVKKADNTVSEVVSETSDEVQEVVAKKADEVKEVVAKKADDFVKDFWGVPLAEAKTNSQKVRVQLFEEIFDHSKVEKDPNLYIWLRGDIAQESFGGKSDKVFLNGFSRYLKPEFIENGSPNYQVIEELVDKKIKNNIVDSLLSEMSSDTLSNIGSDTMANLRWHLANDSNDFQKTRLKLFDKIFDHSKVEGDRDLRIWLGGGIAHEPFGDVDKPFLNWFSRYLKPEFLLENGSTNYQAIMDFAKKI